MRTCWNVVIFRTTKSASSAAATRSTPSTRSMVVTTLRVDTDTFAVPPASAEAAPSMVPAVIAATHIAHQQSHQEFSSAERVLVRRGSVPSGRLAAQVSPRTYRGIQNQPIGTNQPPIAQPRA